MARKYRGSLPAGFPRVINHGNLLEVLDYMEAQIGTDCASVNRFFEQRDHVLFRIVTLEFPTGELAKDFLSRMALVGRSCPRPVALTGKEGFDAQGLEGKVQARMELWAAITKLRDILPAGRGRIVVE